MNRVDTIFCTTNAQNMHKFIMMHWGSSTTISKAIYIAQKNTIYIAQKNTIELTKISFLQDEDPFSLGGASPPPFYAGLEVHEAVHQGKCGNCYLHTCKY